MKKYVWYHADDEEDSMWETEDNDYPERSRWVRWSDVGSVFDAAMAAEKHGALELAIQRLRFDMPTSKDRVACKSLVLLVDACRRAKEGQ